jgi:hypothetical protein
VTRRIYPNLVVAESLKDEGDFLARGNDIDGTFKKLGMRPVTVIVSEPARPIESASFRDSWRLGEGHDGAGRTLGLLAQPRSEWDGRGGLRAGPLKLRYGVQNGGRKSSESLASLASRWRRQQEVDLLLVPSLSESQPLAVPMDLHGFGARRATRFSHLWTITPAPVTRCITV